MTTTADEIRKALTELSDEDQKLISAFVDNMNTAGNIEGLSGWHQLNALLRVLVMTGDALQMPREMLFQFIHVMSDLMPPTLVIDHRKAGAEA